MRQTATVTSKGQLTIPHAFRERMKLAKGDRVVFEEKNGVVTVSPEHDEDPFEEFRGIGIFESGKGKRTALNWVRDIRGEL